MKTQLAESYSKLIKEKSLNPNWNEADHEWAARMLEKINANTINERNSRKAKQHATR